MMTSALRSRRPRARGLTLATAGIIAGSFLGMPTSVAAQAATPLCRDVSAMVGIDFKGSYGATVASSPMGRMMQRNMGNGAAVGDYDADGDLDVYLLGQQGHANRLFRNTLSETGQARFTDVTEAAGVGDEGLGRVAHFADLDGDALLDLVVINDTDPEGTMSGSRLYRNDGEGAFEDVTEGSGFAPIGFIVGGASLSDADRDGDLDIFITYWTQELGADPARMTGEGVFPARNTLYRNDGSLTFTDVTKQSGLGGVSRDSFSSVVADFDMDDDQDIYIAVDHQTDLYYEQTSPMTWTNRSGQSGATHIGNDMGIAVTDLDSDGLLDLYTTNISDPEGVFGFGSGNTLLMSELAEDGSVHFVDRAAELGVLDTAWGWGTAFMDFDLDGDLDLYAVQGMDEMVADGSIPLRDATSRLFLGDAGVFVASEGSGCEVAGDQRALVPFDYDRDGDVDLLITQVDGKAVLLENRVPSGRSITVDVSGGGAAGPGSRVTVEADGRSVTQVLLRGGNYLAGVPLEAVFGLGAAERAETVTVRWADGRETKLTDVPSGSLIRPLPGHGSVDVDIDIGALDIDG